MPTQQPAAAIVAIVGTWLQNSSKFGLVGPLSWWTWDRGGQLRLLMWSHAPDADSDDRAVDVDAGTCLPCAAALAGLRCVVNP